MKLNVFIKSALALLLILMAGICGQKAKADTVPYFMLINQSSGKALDLIGGNMANGAVTNQWTADYNGPNQRWALSPTPLSNHFKLISWVSGKAVSVSNNSMSTGAQIWAWDFTGDDPGQEWDLVDAGNGWYYIRNVHSGLVLDVANASTADNAMVQQWTNVGSPNQKWRLQPWGNYNIKAASGKYICCQGGGTAGAANGATIIQYTYENNPWFKWLFTSEGDGFYGLFSLNSPSRVLCVDQGSSAAGFNCHLWDYNPNNVGDQKVRIVPKLDGKYKFYFKHDGMSWDIPGGSVNNDVPLQQYPDNANSWQEFTLERADSTTQTSNSIFSVAASSIPTPVGAGAISFRVMNGTNGAYPDSQIYWGVLGINPVNGKWSYLDINGNLQPISAALNDAAGHLVKNGVNYANIYSTISQKQWVNMPKLTSGRMFISTGSPCYIKTYDTGFAGPDINNPADPNRNIYFDFIEFTLNDSGYHGNTTRVDMFGFPLQHRLVNSSNSYDHTVGENESETRAGIFSEYQNEVPAEFKSLGTVQAPYRIVAPIHGSFAAGQPNANYFSSYTSISTQDILMGVGGAADPNVCAAINRHVYTQPQSTWGTVSNYYNAAPANYYAKFWHPHAIAGLAYGFCYDDVNQQAAYLEVGSPKGLIIRVGG